MRFEGTLSVWNPERGYGAIAPEAGGQEVFVHISAFPTDGAPPVSGEVLSFEIVTTSDGRKQAARVLRSRRAVPKPMERFMAPAPQRRGNSVAAARRSRRRIGLALVGSVLVLGALGAWQYLAMAHADQVQQQQQASSAHKPARMGR